jgi:hypothetical protein
MPTNKVLLLHQKKKMFLKLFHFAKPLWPLKEFAKRFQQETKKDYAKKVI